MVSPEPKVNAAKKETPLSIKPEVKRIKNEGNAAKVRTSYNNMICFTVVLPLLDSSNSI